MIIIEEGKTEGILPKSRLAVILFAWFLGSLGLHRLYIGKIGTGLVILILGILGWATTWILGLGYLFLAAAGIWVFIDLVMALFGAMKDKDGKPIKNW
jgi:TM2 domain-containing membrane protein YozV